MSDSFIESVLTSLRNSPTRLSLSLLRPGLLFLLGSWFLQVGLTSFGTDNEVGPVAPWDHQQHQTGMAVPIVFAFHVFGCFAFYGALLILAQAVAARGLLQPLEKHEHAYFAPRGPGARALKSPQAKTALSFWIATRSVKEAIHLSR